MCAWILLCLLAGQKGTVESARFPKPVQEKALYATVRVGGGSGAIIAQRSAKPGRGPFVTFVLTANHCVESGDTTGVHFYSEDTYPDVARTYPRAEVVARSKDADLALLRVATREPFSVLPVCPHDKVPKEKSFPAFSAASNKGSSPTCELRDVTMKKFVRRPGAANGTWYWETLKEPPLARSGGPLVDSQGFLLGVLSGTNDGKGYYPHIDTIHAFLEENGFERLFRAEKKP